jgi:pimeloyl-ACP methyl ester carboxylesterase
VQTWQTFEHIVNGQHWRYVDTQPQGDQAIALLLHGFTLGSSLLTYAPLVSYLHPDYRVIVPDLPGFGGSDALTTDTPDSEAYAHALAAFVDALELSSFFMVAFSMGGAVTLRYLRQHAERVCGLVLVSSYGLRTMPFPPLALPLSLRGQLAEHLANPLLASPVRIKWVMQHMVLSQTVDNSLVEEVLENRLELPPAFMAWLRAEVGWFGHRHNDAEVLTDITCPIHLLHGSRDMVVPVWDSRRAARRYNLPITVIPKCGHWLPRQAPRVLEHHLRSLDKDAFGKRNS